MRRGSKPPKAKFKAKRPLARKSPKSEGSRVRDLEKRLAEALKDRAEAVEQLSTTADILRLIAESPGDLDAVLDGVLGNAIRLTGAETGAIVRFDGDLFHLVAQRAVTPRFLETAARVYPFAPHPDSPSTKAITERQPIYIEDAFEASYSGTRDIARAVPFRSLLTLPMLREGRGIGTISLVWADVRPFPADRIEVLQTFADQAVIAVENVRLFKELADKSRQLEIASQHKSEFLANMSHELRTPLNAIIGFSEVLSERMFGELNEKQDEYLKDIYASGQHLLSLINDILDLSKIEAGRLELELAAFDLPTAIDNALTLVRERAARHGIAVQHEVDARLGQVQGDERKLKQVLLNLLSNAIKFTPEGGRIDVRAALVDGMAEVSVADTGVGIAPEDQEAIFEEFRQVGTADKKVEGTGLGLTLSRKFVEMHGGRIWVQSQVGAGSTFTFTIPMRRGA